MDEYNLSKVTLYLWMRFLQLNIYKILLANNNGSNTEEKPYYFWRKRDHTKQDFDIENGDLEQLFAETEDADG